MSNQLREIARKQLDENEFSAARESYRKLIISASPLLMDFAALEEAEENEEFLFLKNVRDKYPTSLDAHLAVALFRSRMRQNINAIVLFLDILENFYLVPEMRYRIQEWLFDALCEIIVRRPDYRPKFFELFRYLWIKPRIWQWRVTAIRNLMRKVHGSEAKQIFKELQKEAYLPAEIIKLLELKCKEIDALVIIEQL